MSLDTKTSLVLGNGQVAPHSADAHDAPKIDGQEKVASEGAKPKAKVRWLKKKGKIKALKVQVSIVHGHVKKVVKAAQEAGKIYNGEVDFDDTKYSTLAHRVYKLATGEEVVFFTYTGPWPKPAQNTGPAHNTGPTQDLWGYVVITADALYGRAILFNEKEIVYPEVPEEKQEAALKLTKKLANTLKEMHGLDVFRDEEK